MGNSIYHLLILEIVAIFWPIYPKNICLSAHIGAKMPRKPGGSASECASLRCGYHARAVWQLTRCSRCQVGDWIDTWEQTVDSELMKQLWLRVRRWYDTLEGASFAVPHLPPFSKACSSTTISTFRNFLLGGIAAFLRIWGCSAVVKGS